MRRSDVLIAGGGPAGSAAGIALARSGARPLIVERHAEPRDALCGGFLSWRTLDSLERLGLARDALGGHPVSRVALYAGGRSAGAALPRPAMGLSRRRLDALLLARAEEAGADVLRGETVRSADPRGARLASGANVECGSLILATGKHDLRGHGRPSSAGDSWMGLRFRFAPSPRLTRIVGDAIELHLFERGYAGLLLQEDGSANLCMALRRSRLVEAGSDPAALLAALIRTVPSLAARFGGEAPRASSDAIGLVPYGWRARETLPGLFRAGDQAAVIASLAGEGIGIALASGERAARAWLAGGAGAAPRFQHGFARRARRPLAAAGAAMRLAESPRGARAGLLAARMPGLLGLLTRLTRIAA